MQEFFRFDAPFSTYKWKTKKGRIFPLPEAGGQVQWRSVYIPEAKNPSSMHASTPSLNKPWIGNPLFAANTYSSSSSSSPKR